MPLPFRFQKMLLELGDEIEYGVQPLVTAVQEPLYLYRFLHQIGWDVDSIIGIDLEKLVKSVTSLYAKLLGTLNALQNPDDFEQVGPALMSAIQTLDSLMSDLDTMVESLIEFSEQDQDHHVMLIKALAHDIAEHLFMRYLASRAPTIFALALLFGVLHRKRVTPLYAIKDSEVNNPLLPPPLRYPITKVGINYRGLNETFILPMSALMDNLDGSALSSPEAFFAVLQQSFSAKLSEIADVIQQRGMGTLVVSLDFVGIGLSLNQWLPTISGDSDIVIPFVENQNTPNLTISSTQWTFNWTELEGNVVTPVLGEYLFLLNRFTTGAGVNGRKPGVYLTLEPDGDNKMSIRFEISVGLKLILGEAPNNETEIALYLKLDNQGGGEALALQLVAQAYGELVIPLTMPGLTGMAVGIDSPRAEAELRLSDGDYSLLFKLGASGFSIRLPAEIFKKANKVNDVWQLIEGFPQINFSLDDPDQATDTLLEVILGKDEDNTSLTISKLTLLEPQGTLSIETDGAIFIGLDSIDKGFIIEVERSEYSFADPGNSIEAGLYIKLARVYLPQIIPALPDELLLEEVSITESGFSGKLTVLFDHDPENPQLLFGVLPIQFYSLALAFRDNVPIEFDMQAAILLPYFDEWVEIALSINEDFDILFHVESLDPEGITLTSEELLELTFKSADFEYYQNETLLKLSLSGAMQPLLWNADGLEWPKLDVTNLSLEQNLTPLANGSFDAPIIKFEEAWLDLNDLASLDLFGFHFELNRIGMGYVEETDRLWVDLTGSLRLIEQIPVGLGVEGFRLTWPRTLYEQLDVDPKDLTLDDILNIAGQIEVKFEGIYLFFGIPQTAEFEGYIRFIKEAQKIGFAGDVALRLPATGLAVEAGLLVGMNFEEPPFPFLYVYFGILLPSGIPLGQSGLALKGAQGLFGLNVEPDREPDRNPYYDWYKRGPIEGAHPTNKWRDRIWSVAFGAGITITTTDGKILGVKGLLVLVIPGPIIMIEGKALVFDGLFPGGDSPLKALAYFDGNELTMQLNIEAALELVEGVIDINAGIEAFFDFRQFENWHLYLGKDQPEERRIYANLLKLPMIGWLFQANCYVMLDMLDQDTVRSRMGMYIGFEPPAVNLVVASASIKAVIEGQGLMTINPFQFEGDIGLDAIMDVKVFGLNVVGVEASADVAIEGALPLVVDAKIQAHVDLPIPDLESVPAIGEWVDSAVGWFEENVAEIPDIPEYIEFEVPFHWEFAGVPNIAPLVSDVIVESQWVRGGGSIIQSGIVSNDRAVLTSLTVPVDSKPSILFDQNMNHPSEYLFAGYSSGEVARFYSGKLAFKPMIRDVVVSRLAKHDYDPESETQNWIEIGRASANDPSLKLWAFYRPAFDGDAGVGRRLLTLWNTNVFDFMINTVPVEMAATTEGQDQGGQSSSSAFLEGNQASLVSEQTVRPICIDQEILKEIYKNNAFSITQVPNHQQYVQEFIIAGLVLQSYSLALTTRKSALAGGTVYEVHGNSAHTSYVKLHLRFPETVYALEVEGDSNYANFNYTTKKDSMRFESSVDPKAPKRKSPRCADPVEHQLAVNPKGFTIVAEGGFDCLEIRGRESFRFTNICWTSIAEIERAQVREDEETSMKAIISMADQLEPLLLTGNYFKIEVAHSIELDEVYTDYATIKLLENVPAFQGALDVYRSIGGGPEIRQEQHYFQTDGPPNDLSPYIKWITPAQTQGRHFYGDDFVLRFNRAYLSHLYPDADNSNDNIDHYPFALDVIIKDNSDRVIRGYFHNWTKSQSASLMPDEKRWYDSAQEQLDLTINNPTDDILEIRHHSLMTQLTEFSRKEWTVILLSKSRGAKPKWKVGSDEKISVQKLLFSSVPALMRKLTHGNAGSVFISGDYAWHNYHFQTTLDSTLEANSTVGVVFLYQANKDHYRLQISRSQKIRLQLVKVKRGNETVISESVLPVTISTLIAGRRSVRSRTKIPRTFSVSVKKVKDQLHIEARIGQHSLSTMETHPLGISGKIGLYSSGVAAQFSKITVINQVQSLLPNEKYTLLVTGGEGGKTLFKDSFESAVLGDDWTTVDDGWSLVNNMLVSTGAKRKLSYNTSVEDFELLLKLVLAPADSISVLLRTPDVFRQGNNQTFYELNITRGTTALVITLNVKDDKSVAHYELETKRLIFANIMHVPIRVRMIGNLLKVWVFDRLSIDQELEEYSIPVTSRRPTTRVRDVYRTTIGLNRIAVSRDIIRPARPSIPLINSRRTHRFLLASSGKLEWITRVGVPKIDMIEIKEVTLYSHRFTTSQYASYRELVTSNQPSNASLTIKDVNYTLLSFNMELKALIESQRLLTSLSAELIESKVLYSAKRLNREALESLKQDYSNQQSLHDERYYVFMNKSNSAYLQAKDWVSSYSLTDINGELLGYILKSPETLDPMHITVPTTTTFGSLGRTRFELVGSDDIKLPCYWISSADGTSVFIYQLIEAITLSQNTTSNELEAAYLTSSDHRLNSDYKRNYHDDALSDSNFDHLLDRPYRLTRSKSETEQIRDVYL